MNGHYQNPTHGYNSAQGSSYHYSHPYAPNGEPSQPLRSGYGIPHLGTNGVENGQQSYEYSATPSPVDSRHSYSSPNPVEPYVDPRRMQDGMAIPAPVIKADYAAPVFQTFQERKRAKEAALRAQGLSNGESPRRVYTPPAAAVEAGPPGSGYSAYHPPPSHSPQPILAPEISISPSVHTPDQRPYPIPSPSPGPFPNSMPPPARPTSSRPLPSPINTDAPRFEAGPSTPRTPLSARTPISPSILERSDTVSSVKSLDRAEGFGSPSKRPLPKPPVAVITSKSLDRGIPGGMGVLSGSGPSTGSYEKKTGRRLPSTVTEMSEGSEERLVMDMGQMSISRTASPIGRSLSPDKPSARPLPPTIVLPDAQSTRIPQIVEPPTIIEPGPTSIPSIVVPPLIVEPPTSEPATYSALPSFSFPDDDEDETPAGGSGIAFTGLPSIAVSSIDSSHQSLPSINVASAPSAGGSRQMPTWIDPTMAIICVGCNLPIIGRIVSAMDQRWHPQCFKCGECKELLEHVSSYEYEGKPYCHLDYHDKFAHRCHQCKTPIVEPRFITLDDPVLGQRYYHELHFFCSECGDPFLDPSRSSAPGTEGNRSSRPEEEETNAFVIQKGHPYCERCHLRLHKPKCKGCKRPIPDMAVDAMGGKWHQECFVCDECGNGFANSLFFPNDGKAFCTECYGIMVGN